MTWRLFRVGLPFTAIGIVVCAIGGPTAAFQASIWSSRAGDAEARALQNVTVLVQQLVSGARVVNEDVRLFGSYAELTNYAIAVRTRTETQGNPQAALVLWQEAQVRTSLAASVRQMMRTTGLRTVDDGHPEFAYGAALHGELRSDPASAGREESDRLRSVASAARATAVALAGAAVGWAVALVGFTFAQIASPGSRQRSALATFASTAALAAAGLTIVQW